MCSLCSQQWIVKTSFRWFFVIGKWKSCWWIKKAVVTEIFIMWSFVSVQAILCSTLCYLVKWFNSCSFTMEQKNTCAMERRENKEPKHLWYNHNDSSGNNDNKEARVLNSKRLWTSVFLCLNEITFQQNCFFRKSAVRGKPKYATTCHYAPSLRASLVELPKTFTVRSGSREWISRMYYYSKLSWELGECKKNEPQLALHAPRTTIITFS